MTLYKLTDANDQTHGNPQAPTTVQWGPNICIETSGEGDLCGPGWTHWYTDPLLAVLLNPIHAESDLATAHLWEGHGGEGETRDDHGLKVGCTRGTTVRRVELPVVTTEQRIRFAIRCAWAVYHDQVWRSWAVALLSGADRSRAARAARAAARAAAEARAFGS